MRAPLRLLVYDRLCRGRRSPIGLSDAWAAGRALYGALGRIDAAYAAESWKEALAWLASVGDGRSIGEIQFWGHGRWGEALIGSDVLDVGALRPGHPLHDGLARVRERMRREDDGLWWFRTCETFGGEAGHRFARAWTRFFGCRAAGHTHVIGFWQSGLHTLDAGAEPSWPMTEGQRPETPGIGLPSRPWAPNTITCFAGRVPHGF